MGTKKIESGHSEMINNLKIYLKKRKLSYRILAREIGMSESGLKKLMNAKDISLQRLVNICQVLGISVADLIKDEEVSRVSFSSQQELEFEKNPILFQVYWLLVYERRSADKIQTALRLNKGEMFKLLRKLDKINLIKISENDRLIIPTIKAISWTGQSHFIRKLYKEWSLNFLEKIAKPYSESSDEHYTIRYLQMRKETYKEMINAMKKLEKDYIHQAIHEMRLNFDDLQHVRWVMASDNLSFITEDDLR